MSKKSLSKVLVLIISLSIPVMLAATCEPPGDGERLSGPAIVGTVRLNSSYIYFEGNCEGKPIALTLDNPFPIESLTADDLKDFRYRGGITDLNLGSCYPFTGDIIINTVSDFENKGYEITADVVILAVRSIH